MKRTCLIGHPVAHSRSPLIHNYWLSTLGIEGAYGLEDLAPAQFVSFIRDLPANGYVGANVTLPHKEAAYRTVEVRDDAAEAVGAVNTLWLDNGRLIGGNSDAYGFAANLDDCAPGWNAGGCRALVLGAGGAARASVHALRQRGVEVHVANRTHERAQELARRLGARAHPWDAITRLLPQADLLVNSTSLGVAGKAPLAIDLAPLKAGALVYDLNYVPLDTPLLAQARARGHRTVDGLGMLLEQALYGFRKWFGGEPKVTPELRALVEADLKKG